MTDAESKELMERHGITTSQQSMYFYQGFKYGSLADAVRYAERQASVSRVRGSPDKPARSA